MTTNKGIIIIGGLLVWSVLVAGGDMFELTSLGRDTCPSSTPAAQMVAGRSRIHCGVLCEQYPRCIGYNYRRSQAACDLFTKDLSNFTRTAGCEHWQVATYVLANEIKFDTKIILAGLFN